MIFRDIFEQIFRLEVSIAAAVFVLVLAAVTFALVRRRARRGAAPSRRTSVPVVEGCYAVLLAGIAAFLVYSTASANSRLHRSIDPERTLGPGAAGPAGGAQGGARGGRAAVNVDVVAFQWCWNFRYTGRPVNITNICTNGRFPTMVVPTGRPVQIRLTSTDVQHSFWVPALKIKVDAFPNHTNSFTLTFDHAGQWHGRCAEFCGVFHATMDFYLKAVPPDQYDRWLQQHQAAA
ncbi:MAG TPA: cytochrome c oxidase subunit II [Streptosporangiaceae bacterium]